MTLSSLSDVREIDFPRHGSREDGLTVFQSGAGVPFPIARAFVVNATAGSTRGQHAHKACNQLMVALGGRCEVRCTDGVNTGTYRLEASDRGLLVPAGLWAEETYLDEQCLLLVLCDRPYEESDYLRDYPSFLQYRNKDRGL
jgi:dTDP-4-dehydrorhamnose 3,5-epimerase-like enzyme